jgi:predicted nucleotidyltransferase
LREWDMDYQEALQKRRSFSEDQIALLRKQLSGKFSENISVVVTGSYARREASAESDIDYFLIGDASRLGDSASAQLENAQAIASEAATSLGIKPPSMTGAFAQSETVDEMTRNVGGNDDPNFKLTHRLLLLLEGEWLAGEGVFHDARKKLLEDVYVRAEISDHQIARFLLNDVIRYWRTMGVDFEYKTQEGNKGWGIRNIKLVYSRKLMYFSGVLMVAETAQSTRRIKLQRLSELLVMTPIERVQHLFGRDCESVLQMYVKFLGSMSDGAVRKDLEEVSINRAGQNDAFRDLKNEGHHFSLELEQLLRRRYPPSHPIHHAMLF